MKTVAKGGGVKSTSEKLFNIRKGFFPAIGSGQPAWGNSDLPPGRNKLSYIIFCLKCFLNSSAGMSPASKRAST